MRISVPTLDYHKYIINVISILNLNQTRVVSHYVVSLKLEVHNGNNYKSFRFKYLYTKQIIIIIIG